MGIKDETKIASKKKLSKPISTISNFYKFKRCASAILKIMFSNTSASLSINEKFGGRKQHHIQTQNM